MGKFQAGVCEELTLYARQHAWLNTPQDAPDAPGSTHRTRSISSRAKAAEDPARSRADQLLDEGAPLPLPAIGDPALQLWRHLLDAGPAVDGGMGRAPLSWLELSAWQRATAQPLAPWQLRALRQASRAWAAELHAAAKPDAPPPWSAVPSAVEREIVRNKVRALFGARARAQAEPVKDIPA